MSAGRKPTEGRAEAARTHARARRWLPQTGTPDARAPRRRAEGARAPLRWGRDSCTGQGALDGHRGNVVRPWTDQADARGGLVTVDRGQPSRPGARRPPGPSAAPAPLCWPAPLRPPAACVWLSAELPAPRARPPSPADFSQVLSHMVPVKLHIFPCRLKRHTFLFARQFADCSVGSISYWISQKT